MPVLACPDCNGKVSDSAPSCPHCGRPMHAASAPPEPQVPQYVQPIERTGKKWKSLGCLGACMIFAGFGIMFGVGEMGSDRRGVWAAGLIMIGLVVALYGKIGAWWHHD
jgi:hypothetical protein